MLLFLHHVQQDFSGLAACFFIEKMGCGQCGGRGPGNGGITEPGDLYLLRNRDFLLVEIPQGAGGNGIGGAQKGVNVRMVGEQLPGYLIAGFHREDGLCIVAGRMLLSSLVKTIFKAFFAAAPYRLISGFCIDIAENMTGFCESGCQVQGRVVVIGIHTGIAIQSLCQDHDRN